MPMDLHVQPTTPGYDQCACQIVTLLHFRLLGSVICLSDGQSELNDTA